MEKNILDHLKKFIDDDYLISMNDREKMIGNSVMINNKLRYGVKMLFCIEFYFIILFNNLFFF